MAHTIYRVDTIQDFQALPVDLQLAIRMTPFNPHGKRFIAEMRKAERKVAIQRAVQRALAGKYIGEELAVGILKTNKAYGPMGRAAISAALRGELPDNELKETK